MSNVTEDPEKKIQKLYRKTGSFIAYHALTGSSSKNTPGIIFLTGFMSDMNGEKAMTLENFAREQGHSFIRFDFFGHGQSEGKFEDGHISIWLEDALAVLDELTQGPQILVGSSMGGWIMLRAAMERPTRIAGLIGIAAAPDFTEELLLKELTQEQRTEIDIRGFIKIPSNYESDYIFTKTLFEEGRSNLVLRDDMPINCPIRLIHGIRDESVAWQTALRIQEKIVGPDVEITLIKDGDHRLSSPADLERLCKILANMIDGL